MANHPNFARDVPSVARQRYRAGDLLLTTVVLALFLTAMLWTSVYFKRNSDEGTAKPSQPQATASAERQPGTKAKLGTTEGDQTSPPDADAAPDTVKKTPGSEEKKSDPSGDFIDVMMALVAIFSVVATAVTSIVFWNTLQRAFPDVADGLMLSSLLGMLAFGLGSMLRRWHNIFEWVFWAYVSAAVGYFIELRFRFCNHLIDDMVAA